MQNSNKSKKKLTALVKIGILLFIFLFVVYTKTLKSVPKIAFQNNMITGIHLQENDMEDIVSNDNNPLQVEEHVSKNIFNLSNIKILNNVNYSIPDFPVDVVYTWVNGSDPIWIKKKDKAMKDNDVKIAKRAQTGRYVDIGELKYSLRCVEKFIPWVNKIYIVTDNQFPSFLKKGLSKIEVISHEQIIPNEFLPTFNSNNIDFHLHRIPNLSEHFIYLNDDVFISRPLKRQNFYDASGNPKLPVANYNWGKHKEYIERLSLRHWNRNDMGSNQYNLITMHTVDVFEKKFNFTVNFKCRHGYIPLTVSLMTKIWDNFEKELSIVETHVFRSFQDIQMPTLLIQFGIGLSYCSILHTSRSVRYLVMTGQFMIKLKNFNSSDYDSFCMNSGERTSDHMRIAAKNFLQKTYPGKSSFEV